MTTLGIFIWSHYLYSCILTMSPDVKNAFFCHILFKLTMSRFHPCLSWEANDLEVTCKNVHATITFPSKQLFCAYGGFSWPGFFGRIAESQIFSIPMIKILEKHFWGFLFTNVTATQLQLHYLKLTHFAGDLQRFFYTFTLTAKHALFHHCHRMVYWVMSSLLFFIERGSR